MQGQRVAVGSVRAQQAVLDGVNARQLLVCQFTGVVADYRGINGHAQLGSELLSRGQSLERHAVPHAVALFQYCQDAHSARASKRSFSTSFAAAWRGSPSKIWDCLERSGINIS